MQPWNTNKASDEDKLNHFVQRPMSNVEIHIALISRLEILLHRLAREEHLGMLGSLGKVESIIHIINTLTMKSSSNRGTFSISFLANSIFAVLSMCGVLWRGKK